MEKLILVKPKISLISLMQSNKDTSFWDSKPYWCKPWSIIGFGILTPILCWCLSNSYIITFIISIFIIIWWVLFLIIVPNTYQGLSDKE